MTPKILFARMEAHPSDSNTLTRYEATGGYAGLRKALQLASNEPELRRKLWHNVAFMQKKLADGGVPIGDSTSQVIPIMVRDDARVFQIGEEIFREGVFINPVKYPAVGKHKSRFRMSISAAHTREELEEGAGIIVDVLRRNGII